MNSHEIVARLQGRRRTQGSASARWAALSLSTGQCVLLVVALAVVPALLLALRAGFDGLYGQDAFAYADYALGPVRDWLRAGRLSGLPAFYWPPGYPILVALASFAVGPRPLTGQIVSLGGATVAAAATTLLAGDVARELVRDRESSATVPGWFVPLVAGGAVAATGQLWQSGIVVMADTTGLAAATLAAVGVARYGRSRRLGWLLLAAVAMAWATISRWIFGLVAVPFALATLVYLWQGDRRRGLLHGLAASILGLLIVAPVLVPALANLGGQAAFNADFQVYSWSPLNALRREFPTADGLLSYRFPNGLYYLLAPALPPFMAPLLVLFAPFGLVPCWRGRRSPLVLLVIGWLVVGYAFHAGAPWQNIRFVLAYLPPLAILSALGARQVIVATRRPWLVSAVLGIGLVWTLVGGARLLQDFLQRKEADLAIVRWVDAQTPANARLVTFGLSATFQHYSALDTEDVFDAIPDKLTSDRPTYLLLDVDSVEHQWQGLAPDLTYRALADAGRLVPLGEQRGYTLFVVQPAA
jgi:4-amino-4-deoxy-L-arabinose transferase-like glycosyltransferase